jgi:hypothetical protein
MSYTGKRLIESAQQALDFAKGTANAKDYRVHIPDDILLKQKPGMVRNIHLPAKSPPKK